ncbi:MAG TPA: hypothetical protein VIU61_15890, partial [Kofleriaceae bacterium]
MTGRIAPSPTAILEVLERHLTIMQCKVRGATIEKLAHDLASQTSEGERTDAEHLVSLIVRMKRIAERAERDLEDVEERWQVMCRRYFAVSEPLDRRRVMV